MTTSQATRSHFVECKNSSVNTSLVCHLSYNVLITETMATELQGKLLHLTDSPNANTTTLPSLFDTEVIHSPQHSVAPEESPVRRRLRTVPSDPCLAFSRPRARVGTGNSNEIRELRLAAVRAEEDAALIAQLESALADARDSEEAQRKAAARLRRDLSRMKRELEHAEDVITDHQRTEKASSEVGRERFRAVDRVAEWTRGTSSLSRARGSYGPPEDDQDEPVGWGATSFPEFPRDDDVSSEAGTEVATVSPTREDVREATPEGDVAPESDDGLPTDNQSQAPTVIVPERVRPRPIITATTFATPSPDSVASNGTPQVTVDPPSSRPSSVHGANCSLRATRSVRSSGSASSLLRESMRVRSQSYVPGGERLSPVQTFSSSGSVGVGRGHSPSASIISGYSQDSERSRIDSVRSIFSAVVGLHRSLGSELGSGFHPTPTKEGEEAGFRATPTSASLAPLTPLGGMRKRQVHSRQPSSPTATFHFKGTLESPSRASAYDYEHPDAPRRMGPVAAEWSPQSWPTPTPPPRDVPIPPVPELYYPDEHQEPELRTPVPTHISWPPMPGAGPGATPSPHATTGLAPCADPWDEYSDRPTPSPRARNLRPLLLCTRPAMHMRTSSLALARERAARGVGYKGLARESMPVSERIPEPTPSNVAVAYAHRGGVHLVAPRRASPELILPVTIPGRITHDLFCLVLVFIDYLEWFIILLYRFTIDIRAGPGGAEPAL